MPSDISEDEEASLAIIFANKFKKSLKMTNRNR